MAGLAASQKGHTLTKTRSFAPHRFGARSSPRWSSRSAATRRPCGRSKCRLSMRGAFFCQLRDQRVRHPCTTDKKILQSTVSKLPREHVLNFHVDDSACHVTDDGTSYFDSLANEMAITIDALAVLQSNALCRNFLSRHRNQQRIGRLR